MKSVNLVALVMLIFFITKAWTQEGLGPVEVTSIAFSPDGSKIAIASGPHACAEGDLSPFAIQIQDVQSNQIIQSLQRHLCLVNTIAWSPDGTKLASSGEEGLAFVWDVTTAEVLSAAENSSVGVPRRGVIWDPNGQLIADFSVGGPLVSIWEAATGVIKASLGQNTGPDITSLAWSPDGSRLAIGNGASEVQIWDVAQIASGGLAEQLTTFPNLLVTAIEWSPDGSRIAIGGKNNVVILDASTGQQLEDYIGHTATVISIAWSPDNTRLASGSLDNTVRVWVAQSGELINSFQASGAVMSVAWSPDGTQLAFGTASGGLQIVDVPPLTPIVPCTTTIPAADTPYSDQRDCIR